MKIVTGEEVRDAMFATGEVRAIHHRCAICKSSTEYVRVGASLYYDPICVCTPGGERTPMKARSWDSVADWINMQVEDKFAIDIMKRFGLNPENYRE